MPTTIARHGGDQPDEGNRILVDLSHLTVLAKLLA
jgi:hypothetical protein